MVGCAAPQKGVSTLDYLRDKREFSTMSFYGSSELQERVKMFGRVDLHSPYGANTSDLTRFNGRIRATKDMSENFGLVIEGKDSSGDNNNVASLGFSYKPTFPFPVEVRVFPARTDGTHEAGLNFRKSFGKGNIKPYVNGILDVKEDGEDLTTSGECQIGLEAGSWKIFLTERYSDLDRRKGIDNPGIAGGLGIKF